MITAVSGSPGYVEHIGAKLREGCQAPGVSGFDKTGEESVSDLPAKPAVRGIGIYPRMPEQ
jgi:hypothetical protein